MKTQINSLRKGIAILIMAVLIAGTSQYHCCAGTLLVYNNSDSGAGSLRQAIIDNNVLGGGNTIIFSNVVTGTITLTTGELLISNNVSILGPGPAILAVNGNAASRVFHFTNVTATVSGLTITNGSGFNGGGVYIEQAVLTASNCVVAGNLATNGGGIYINGRQSFALLTIVNSALSGNFASSAGGGIFNDASSQGTAQLEMQNCTVNSNLASGGVGGIYNFAPNGDAETYIYCSTFCGNSGNGAGGILNFAAQFPTLVEMGNTILKAGASGANIVSGGVASFISDGYNLCSDAGGGVLTNTTDQINTDPMLGPLQDNGGPTPTMAPLAGSAAIDKGKSFSLTNDQRGEPRPFDWPLTSNATGGDGSDIGAFERGRPRLNIQQIGTNAVLSWPSYYGNGEFSLQSSTNITSSNAWVVAGGSVAVVGNQYQQTNSPISGNRFLRLKSN
jgi:hypothetical protein